MRGGRRGRRAACVLLAARPAVVVAVPCRALLVRALCASLLGGFAVACASPGPGGRGPTEPAAIVVDSTLDRPDADRGDGVCDDGHGGCSLRAAIEEANADGDRSIIEFALADDPDFGDASHPGYTVAPRSGLPAITEPVVIDGYSQPNARPNTAPAPQPLNGRLLVEIDGARAGADAQGLRFDPGSGGSSVRGVVLGGWAGSAVLVGAPNVRVAGSYVGTDPSGTRSNANARVHRRSGAITNVGSAGTDLTIGGLAPRDRNLISGNNASGVAQGADRWTYQGNYVGVAADGLTALGNSRDPEDRSGGATIDEVDGAIIGGSRAGAANVWSGNDNAGVSPKDVSNLTVQGNYFGVGADGSTPVPNDTGFQCGACRAVLIGGDDPAARNIISGNRHNGIGIDQASTDVRIANNHIGVDRTGMAPRPNKVGVFVADSTGIAIGGASRAARNVISANSWSNVLYGVDAMMTGGADTAIQGNYIGVDATGSLSSEFENGAGIVLYGPATRNLIGGVEPGEGNVIAGNAGGVLVADYTLAALALTLEVSDNAVLGNSIYANARPSRVPGIMWSSGIDVLGIVEHDFPPDERGELAPTAAGRPEGTSASTTTTPAPILQSVAQVGTSVTIGFDLPVADRDGAYRVEFFASEGRERSWCSEGQTVLGSSLVAAGHLQRATIEVPVGVQLAGKVVSATATRVDATTRSGFAATSEFSECIPGG